MSTARQDLATEAEHTGPCAGYVPGVGKCPCVSFHEGVSVTVAEALKPLYRYCACGHVQGTHERPAEPAEEKTT